MPHTRIFEDVDRGEWSHAHRSLADHLGDGGGWEYFFTWIESSACVHVFVNDLNQDFFGVRATPAYERAMWHGSTRIPVNDNGVVRLGPIATGIGGLMAVYFIQDDGGEIKVGFSEGNPHRRLNAFRTGNPRELKLLVAIPGGREEEHALHERFADLRTRGEWFKPDPRLLGFIEGMKYAYKDAQPEPVAEDGGDPLSPDQLYAAAGYTYVWSAMIRAGGIARSAGTPLHESLLSAALDCIGTLSIARQMIECGDGMSVGAREAATVEAVEEAIAELTEFLRGPIPKPETTEPH